MMIEQNDDGLKVSVNEDRLALWATIAAFLICVCPVALAFIVRAVVSSLDCPIRFGETLPCMLGSTDIRGFLDYLAMPMYIVQDNPIIVMLYQLVWTAIIIHWIGKRLAGKTNNGYADGTRRDRQLLWAATATFVIGFGPIVSSIVSTEVASWLGCYVNEHGAGTPSSPSDLKVCILGMTDIGPLLYFLHMMIFAGLMTWPFAMISSYLWMRMVMRWMDRRSA